MAGTINFGILISGGLYSSIRNVDGDIVECGVGAGRTFLILAGLARDEGKKRTVWGFDSFEGFPEPSLYDASIRNVKKGQLKLATPELIQQYLLQRGKIEIHFLENNVKIISGFFENSLHQFTGNSIALLHLDVDLYESYKTCLEVLWPKVAKGGVVLFDEYLNTAVKFPGAVKAIDEFFRDDKNLIKVDTTADRYYIFKQ